MQGSWPSPHRNLRFQNPHQPQKRFFFNDLGVVHGRLVNLSPLQPAIVRFGVSIASAAGVADKAPLLACASAIGIRR
jgi:hypothetical protein